MIGTITKPTKRDSLILRYLAFAGAFLVVGLLMYGLIQVFTQYRQQSAELENNTSIQINFLAEVSVEHVLSNNFLVLERLVRQTNAAPDVVYSIIMHKDGRQLTRYIDSEDPDIASALASGKVTDTASLLSTVLANTQVREKRAPIVSDGIEIGEVLLGYSTETVRQRVLASAVTMLVSTLVLSAILLGMTWVLFNWLIGRPLQEVSELARAIESGDLKTRAEVGSMNEIGQLRSAFNAMAEQLQRTLTGLREARDSAESANLALHKSNTESKMLALVASRTNNMVIITNEIGEIEWVNDAFTQLTEYTQDEAIGHRPGDLLQGPDSDQEVVARMREALSNQQGFSEEIINYNKSGEPYWILVEVQPVHDEDGTLTNFIAVESDISERKEHEQRLQEARDAARDADRAKSQFLANMSHEIRTPINGIIGMTGLLLDSKLTAEQYESLDIVRRSSDTLLVIINDILDFSKIEANQLDLESIPFDLHQCVADAVDLFSSQAGKKEIDLAFDIAPHLPLNVVGDITRVRQILVNLVSNALKFTFEGEVVVVVDGKPLPDDRFQLDFSVRDTGIGIKEEDAARLFKAFSQVDASTTRNYGGTGLGLAICKRLSEMMGGRIWLESELGRGSAFNVTIVVSTLEEAVAPETWQLEQPELAEKHVLIVDDNATVVRLASRMLTSWGVKSTSASTVTEALALAVSKKPAFDVALVDQHITSANGVSFVDLMQKRRPEMPILLMNQPGAPNAIERTNNVYTILSKPLKPSHVLNTLQNLLVKKVPMSEVMAPERESAISAEMATRIPLSILIAEDNHINQLVIGRLLKRMGYRVDIAGNGLEVLDAVKRQPYDVILMDVQMPEMDGTEATRRLKADLPPEKCPYIIALTANALTGDREKYLEIGMDDYLSKPVSIDALVGALERGYEVRASMGLSAPVADEPPGVQSAPVTLEPLDSAPWWQPFVDMEQLEMQFGEDSAEMVDELMPLFIEDSTDQLRALAGAVEMRQFDQIKAIAHTLKGASSNLGLATMMALFANLEKAGAASDASNLDQSFKDVSSLMSQLETAASVGQFA